MYGLFCSHVFELNLEELEAKPWRFAGSEMSDYFNFDLTEQTWNDYCQQLVSELESLGETLTFLQEK